MVLVVNESARSQSSRLRLQLPWNPLTTSEAQTEGRSSFRPDRDTRLGPMCTLSCGDIVSMSPVGERECGRDAATRELVTLCCTISFGVFLVALMQSEYGAAKSPPQVVFIQMHETVVNTAAEVSRERIDDPQLSSGFARYDRLEIHWANGSFFRRRVASNEGAMATEPTRKFASVGIPPCRQAWIRAATPRAERKESWRTPGSLLPISEERVSELRRSERHNR